MPSVDEHLERWRAAGLLDEAAIARIRSFEEGSAGPVAPRGRRDGPGFFEALIYLGLAIATVGVVVLVATNWRDLHDWAREAIWLVPGVLAIGAGQALRSLRDPGMVRGGHVAWLAGACLIAGAGAVGADIAGRSGEDIFLVTGLVGLGVALALWAAAPAHPQIVGIGGGMLTLTLALAQRSDEFNFPVAGISLAVLGAAALAFAEAGFLRPRLSARVLAALAVAWGAYFAGANGGWAESLVFVGGPALIALSIWRGAFIYITAGVAAIFVGLISSITRHVDNTSVAALLLILIGALLVASVILLATFRPWVREAAA